MKCFELYVTLFFLNSFFARLFHYTFSMIFFVYNFLPLLNKQNESNKTEIKFSPIDREPRNYSNFAKLFQFFHVIQFLTESKITICMKSIYFYLRRKIYYAQNQFIFYLRRKI